MQHERSTSPRGEKPRFTARRAGTFLQRLWAANSVQIPYRQNPEQILWKSAAAAGALCRYGPVIDALMCRRGIQMTTAFRLAVEIGDWTRFHRLIHWLLPQAGTQ